MHIASNAAHAFMPTVMPRDADLSHVSTIAGFVGSAYRGALKALERRGLSRPDAIALLDAAMLDAEVRL